MGQGGTRTRVDGIGPTPLQLDHVSNTTNRDLPTPRRRRCSERLPSALYPPYTLCTTGGALSRVGFAVLLEHPSKMDARTPKKLVHWALDASLSELASPDFSFAGSSESCTSTSSLQYINSQLVAHGFIHEAGLSLDGLAKGDADRVVKCVLGMLSQRIVSTLAICPMYAFQTLLRMICHVRRTCQQSSVRSATTMNASSPCTRPRRRRLPTLSAR